MYNNSTAAPIQDYSLKPIPYVHATPAPSIYSTTSDYKPVAPSPYTDAELRALEAKDAAVKRRVRVLRIVSRTLATILSAATVAPLVMTLVKFLQTRNQYFVVDGVERTAWASDTVAW